MATLAFALLATQAGARFDAGTWLWLSPSVPYDPPPVPFILVPSDQRIDHESLVGEAAFARAVAFSRDFPCTHKSWNTDPGPLPEPGKPFRLEGYRPALGVTAVLDGKQVQICGLTHAETCVYLARLGTIVQLPRVARLREQFACH